MGWSSVIRGGGEGFKVTDHGGTPKLQLQRGPKFLTLPLYMTTWFESYQMVGDGPHSTNVGVTQVFTYWRGFLMVLGISIEEGQFFRLPPLPIPNHLIYESLFLE